MISSRSALRGIKKFAKMILGQDCFSIQKNYPAERHGSEYGGWDIYPRTLNKDSVVYSVGVGDDISFDLSLIEKYGVTVHAFDPTPKAIAWVKSQRLPEKFNFYEYAVLDYDGIAKFYPPDDPEWVSYTISENEYATADRAITAPVRRLRSIMSELGHQRIDILKMDIEGAEYTVIKDMLRSNIEVSQLLAEFHHRFKDIGIQQTKNIIKLLNKHHYKTFAISSRGDEISLIRTESFYRSLVGRMAKRFG